MLEGENIVIVCEGEWNLERGAEMSSMFPLLLKKNRVLYVDLPTSSQVFYKSPKLLDGRLRRWRAGLIQKGNFYNYAPFPLLPLGNRYSLFNRGNSLLLMPFLRRVMRQLDFTDSILWLRNFNSAPLIGRFGEKIACYSCVDEYTFRVDRNERDEAMVKMEIQMLKRADVVFTTAFRLYEDKRRFNPHTYLIPNAADPEHFGKALLPETLTPFDVSTLNSPIVGFIGTSPTRIDFEYLAYLASREPSWSLVLIGNLDCGEAGELKRFPNVHFLGWRSFKEIPSYLKAFDVCIIPLKVNPQTDTMNVVKLYEYVAAGKPIVSTPLLEVKRFDDSYPGLIKVGKSREEFHRLVSGALTESGESVVKRRLEVARQNTWKKRLEEISKIIYSRLSELEGNQKGKGGKSSW